MGHICLIWNIWQDINILPNPNLLSNRWGHVHFRWEFLGASPFARIFTVRVALQLATATRKEGESNISPVCCQFHLFPFIAWAKKRALGGPHSPQKRPETCYSTTADTKCRQQEEEEDLKDKSPSQDEEDRSFNASIRDVKHSYILASTEAGFSDKLL